MALGLLSLFLGAFCCGVGILAGVPAIVLGLRARSEIGASRGGQGGLGLAMAGTVLGIIGCVLSVLLVILTLTGVITPAIQT